MVLNDLKCWLDAGLSFFYPEVCQICGLARATPDEGYVCVGCWSGIRFIKPPFCQRCGLPYEGEITAAFNCSNCSELDLQFTSARAAVVADGVVREAIHRYKYQRHMWFEPFLADLLIRAAEPELRTGSWDLIVPVPLHPVKQREREFNQAERLARRLGRVVGIPVNTGLLARVEPTFTQTRLSRAERAANVGRAFASRADLKGERVVVLDDVLTTGATTSACARKLKQAGAAEVCVWSVARGL
jgi:competence protein ComFC